MNDLALLERIPRELWPVWSEAHLAGAVRVVRRILGGSTDARLVTPGEATRIHELARELRSRPPVARRVRVAGAHGVAP